jgi:hypothetical protein
MSNENNREASSVNPEKIFDFEIKTRDERKIIQRLIEAEATTALFSVTANYDIILSPYGHDNILREYGLDANQVVDGYFFTFETPNRLTIKFHMLADDAIKRIFDLEDNQIDNFKDNVKNTLRVWINERIK